MRIATFAAVGVWRRYWSGLGFATTSRRFHHGDPVMDDARSNDCGASTPGKLCCLLSGAAAPEIPGHVRMPGRRGPTAGPAIQTVPVLADCRASVVDGGPTVS